jgi:hypothetical protein
MSLLLPASSPYPRIMLIRVSKPSPTAGNGGHFGIRAWFVCRGPLGPQEIRAEPMIAPNWIVLTVAPGASAPSRRAVARASSSVSNTSIEIPALLLVAHGKALEAHGPIASLNAGPSGPSELLLALEGRASLAVARRHRVQHPQPLRVPARRWWISERRRTAERQFESSLCQEPIFDGILGATVRAVIDRRRLHRVGMGPGVTSPKSRPFRV